MKISGDTTKLLQTCIKLAKKVEADSVEKIENLKANVHIIEEELNEQNEELNRMREKTSSMESLKYGNAKERKTLTEEKLKIAKTTLMEGDLALIEIEKEIKKLEDMLAKDVK